MQTAGSVTEEFLLIISVYKYRDDMFLRCKTNYKEEYLNAVSIKPANVLKSALLYILTSNVVKIQYLKKSYVE